MRNVVKRAASDGARIRGVHLTIAEPILIEVLASVGLDFIYLDGEHGAFSLRDIETCCIMAELCGLSTIARVPDRDPATITQFLDRGVKGLVVPHVGSVDEAAEVIAAAYYAPLGQRSFGGGRPHHGIGTSGNIEHLAECNADLSVCIMIESANALAEAGQIAALQGVDYLSFGLNDLSQSMGFAGQPGHENVKPAVADATARIHAEGKRVREDFMTFAWINEILVTGARHLLG